MSDTKVIVIGACGGTGIEVVRQLVAAGDRVIGTVLNASEASTVRSQVPSVAAIAQLDLSNSEQVETDLRALMAGLDDPIAGVIVCAATSNYGPLELLELSAARKVLEVNLLSHLAIYKASLPKLRESGGRLVFMSSFGGKVALPFLGHYVASKFGLEGLCDVMRREASHFGVPVVVVEPGGIRTPMALAQLETIDRDIASLDAEQSKLYSARYAEWKVVAARTCEECTPPENIAKVVVQVFKDWDPEPRYIAGDDARELIALSKRVSDRELDVFMREMYSDVGSIAEMGQIAAERTH